MTYIDAAARLAVAEPEALAVVAASLTRALEQQPTDVPGHEWCSQLGRAIGLVQLLDEPDKLMEWAGFQRATEPELETLRRQAEAMA